MLGPHAASGMLAVRTARLPGAGDPLRARLGFERALGSVAAPAEGLLVIRRLALAISPERSAFGRTVAQRLATCRASARRPWLDPEAASGANAVLFADEAELLACLARDWAAQPLPELWFWRALFGAAPFNDLLRDGFSRYAAALPAAFALLAARQIATAIAARLPDAVAEQARTAMAAAHGLSFDTPRAMPDRPAARRAPAETITAASANAGAGEEAPSAATRPAQAELLALVPEIADVRLGPAQRRLIALALALARAPGWVGTRGLPALSWPIPAPTISTPSAPEPFPGPSTPARTADQPRPEPHPRRTEPWRPAGASRVANAGAAKGPRLTETEDAAPSLHPLEPEATPARRVHGGIRPEMRVPAGPPAAADTGVGHAAAPIAPEEPETAAIISTAFGGLFYLLNVALALGIYGDFTQPLRPGLALSPWDFLALAGHRWFGAAIAADPVSPLLARLGGRSEETPPGTGFMLPAEWQLPPDWLDPWGMQARIGLHVTRRRLLLLHPAGFAIAQTVRGAARPRETARAILDHFPTLRDAALVREAPPSGLPRGGRPRWLALLLGAIAVRLEAALGVPAAEAPALLCRHAAVIRHRPGRLEVALSLAALPIAIRLAGLDRDPGWIPAAGHAVAFRFA